MSTKDILNRTGDEQGWSEDSKLDLLCRFIDNLDVLQKHEDLDPEIMFSQWIENVAKWENRRGEEEMNTYRVRLLRTSCERGYLDVEAKDAADALVKAQEELDDDDENIVWTATLSDETKLGMVAFLEED